MGKGEGSYVWSFSDQDLGAPKKSIKKENKMTEKAAIKKPSTLLAFGEARKTLAFVFPVDSRGHNNFRPAKVLPRRTRGYGRKIGAVIL